LGLLKELFKGAVAGSRFLALVLTSFTLFNGKVIADWKPADPAWLAAKSPRVDPKADAESLVWDVYVEDRHENIDKVVLRHNLVVKIFTERGVEKFKQIELTGNAGAALSSLAARTIQADGSFVEVKKDQMFKRETARTRKSRAETLSFAPPDLRVGSVVEYSWIETRGDQVANYVRLHMQRDIPVWEVRYFIKPSEYYAQFGYRMQVTNIHCKPTPFKMAPGGFEMTSLRDIPAFKAEPFMPGEWQVRPWMLIFYRDETTKDSDKFWRAEGKRIYDQFRQRMRITDGIKAKAASLAEGADSDEAKAVRIANFCRTSLKNVGYSAVPAADREEFFKKGGNKHTGEVLDKMMGTSVDLDLLFVALSQAAGLTANVAFVGDAHDQQFNKQFHSSYFLDYLVAAVKFADGYKFYHPGSPFLPVGLLPSRMEGQAALILDPKESQIVVTPYSPAEKSVQMGRAILKASVDGSIEGDVEETFTGLEEFEKREELEDMTAAERQEKITSDLTGRLPGSEVTALEISDPMNRSLPFRIKYHVKTPSYLTRTGKRLFLPLNFFEHNRAPVFSASERQYGVRFLYGRTEDTQIRLELPEGYDLDSPEAPPKFTVGETGDYQTKLSLNQAGDGTKALIYTKNFIWGRGGRLYFAPEGYQQLKQIFDTIHQGDQHSIVLKTVAKPTTNSSEQ
jgi:hypothetical protein